jgi:transposase-like protein
MAMNYQEFLKKFPSEMSIIDYFIKIKYPQGVKCNYCGSEKVYHRSKEYKVYDCNGCGKDFSVFKDTIFEHTSTDLQKWFYAIHLFLNAKKGISAKQLQREIGVTYKCAWRMLKQIRMAMEDKTNEELYETIVEIDETYIGGKPRNRNNKNDDKKGGGLKRGRGTNKIPVVGIINREEKKIFAKVALANSKGQKLTCKQLVGILNQICKGNNVVISDEFHGYDRLRYTDYIHLKIDHTKMFVDGDIHTNTVESFWAIVKRAIYGIYHKVSVKYLQQYINEFSFRYNHRDIDKSFDIV